MTKKTEALRLADALEDDLHADDGTTLGLYSQGIADNAAAELRRLQALLEAEQALHQRVTYPELQRLRAQRDALLEALKTYGWHTEDCPQYPTYVQPKNWPACTCGFDDAIKAVEEGK